MDDRGGSRDRRFVGYGSSDEGAAPRTVPGIIIAEQKHNACEC